MIEVKNLFAGYRGENILKGVSLKLEAGKVIVLLGPNGSGKSTLLKTMIGLNEKNGGDLLFDGVPFESMTARQRARMLAYMPQNRNIPNILARRMVLHGRFPYLSYPRKYRLEDYRAAEDALQLAGAEALAESYMAELSEGQRQRVYLAMALAQGTETVLMDEPTNFLDVRHQLNLMRLARQMAAQDKCFVMVLHDIRLAMKYADEIIVLENGTIRGDGSPDEIFTSGCLDDVFGIKLSRLCTEAGMQYFYE